MSVFFRECKIIQYLSEGNSKILAEYERTKKQYNYYSLNELHELAKKLKYKLYVTLSLQDKSCYNLIFYKEEDIIGLRNELYKGNYVNLFSGIYANNPLENFRKRKISVSQLRDYLLRYLPDYMIPFFFVELEEMPLDTSGKIDKSSLPDPQFRTNENNFVAPGNEQEYRLCKIWQEILRVDRVGVNDNFFELGGNSLSCIQLANRISNETEFTIRVTDNF